MSKIVMSKISENDLSDKKAWKSSKSSAEMWQEFVDSTSLHGIRYVFMKRHILSRIFWLVIMLTAAGYYIFTVYRAFNKYYNWPINTVVSRKKVKEMDFPAVTVCSLNLFAKSKILMTDDNLLFESSGLNISSCAVTAGVRGHRPCGLSLICCCAPPELLGDVGTYIPGCAKEYKQELLSVMKNNSHSLDIEAFYKLYSQDINSLAGPLCAFGWQNSECGIKDFLPTVTEWGMCYTFNSGVDSPVRKVDTGGVSSGLSFVLDANTSEYTQGKFSEGFKVLIHGQGEYFDQWEGINVGPGQHAVIGLSQKRFKNLKKPFATDCNTKNLKTFKNYTSEGCLYECGAEKKIQVCKCRPMSYKQDAASLHVRTCGLEDINCTSSIEANLDEEDCGCQVPCFQTKYSSEVSYSKFPDPGTADMYMREGYYQDVQYQRDNLVLIQVGFKSLSYEMQEQQPAYDSNSLFGEIGGNMGLFLGCSLLTIVEFLDFFISLLAARRRQSTHPA